MSKPIIGIIGRPSVTKTDTPLIVTMECYRKCLIKMGANPILLLPPQDIDYVLTKTSETPKLTEEEKEMIKKQISLCDGILLPGGYKTFEHDYFIVDYCTKNDIPLLGICLGMQIMASYNLKDEQGQQLLATIKNDEHGINHCIEDKEYVHKVSIKKGSKLYNIFETETFKVNSFHNYHVTLNGDYEIVGLSEDGLIEALENKNNKFNIGVQWHPERMMKDPIQVKIFKEFIKVCKK